MKTMPNLGAYGYVPPKASHSPSLSREIPYLKIGLFAFAALVIVQVIRYWLNQKEANSTNKYVVDEMATSKATPPPVSPEKKSQPAPPEVFTHIPPQQQAFYTYVPQWNGFVLTTEWQKMFSGQ